MAQNMEAVELASRAGLSKVGLSKIENGHVVPRRTTVERIATVLNVPADELMRPGPERMVTVPESLVLGFMTREELDKVIANEPVR